jgi:hypothetical protein
VLTLTAIEKNQPIHWSFGLCVTRNSADYPPVQGLAQFSPSIPPFSKVVGCCRFRNTEIENTFENLHRAKSAAPGSTRRGLPETLVFENRRRPHGRASLAANVSTILRWRAQRDDGEHIGS